MDRRYVPSSEGLESRELLSTASTAANPLTSLFGQPLSTTKTAPADSASTFRLKALRIEHLPFYLNQLQPGRVLPPAIISDIQTDLFEIAATLHPSSSAVLDQFNLQIRDALPRETLTASNVAGLNHFFGLALAKSGAAPQVVESFQEDMSKLAQVDAHSPNPVYLATNDYSVILQSALAVGHLIAQPAVPILAHKDGLQLTGGGVTSNHQPTLVGIYKAGASIDAGTRMQIIDNSGTVLATGFVLNNGRWSATFETPLADGKYVFHAQAVDSFGHVSLPSTRFVLKVVTKPQAASVSAQELTPPQGPLGLK